LTLRVCLSLSLCVCVCVCVTPYNSTTRGLMENLTTSTLTKSSIAILTGGLVFVEDKEKEREKKKKEKIETKRGRKTIEEKKIRRYQLRWSSAFEQRSIRVQIVLYISTTLRLLGLWYNGMWKKRILARFSVDFHRLGVLSLPSHLPLHTHSTSYPLHSCKDVW